MATVSPQTLPNNDSNAIWANASTYTYKNDININYTTINNSDISYKYRNDIYGNAMVQFTKKCEASDTVTFNGGILADDVGLGKTLCCLANVVFDIVNQIILTNQYILDISYVFNTIL